MNFISAGTRQTIFGFLVVASAFILFFSPSRALAATNIYYSVGQNTSNHSSGGTVTISGSTATFSVAQTATNMGIGDIITYGNVGTAFITGKTSTSVWTVSTATGGVPTATTSAPVTSIKHAFASLYNAISAYVANNATSSSFLNTSDLVAGNYVLNIPLYYDSGSDTNNNSISIAGYTTDATHYIRLYTPTSTVSEVNQSQRHQGKYDTTRWNLTANFGFGFGIGMAVNQPFTHIDGLQIKSTASSASGLVSFSDSGVANSVYLSNNIFISPSASAIILSFSFISGGSGNARNLYLWNNQLIGPAATGVSLGSGTWTGASYFYNNTFYNITTGANTNTAHVWKNNLFASTTSPFNSTPGAASDYNSASASSLGYTSNTHDLTSQTFSLVAPASGDLRLTSQDTGAKDHGVVASDANITFSVDAEGHTRPQGSAWDIGADEFLLTVPIISSIASSTVDITATVTWTTDINATSTVNYGLTSGYGSASSSSALVTSHSITLTGLTPSTLYHFQVASADSVNNLATSSDLTFTTTARVTPPVRSAGSPSSTLAQGATSTTISLTTDENATCKYSMTAGTAYGSMTNTFSTTGGTSHSQAVSVADGHSYHYYVRCQDSIPNTNTDDYVINFRVTSSGTIYADSCSSADVTAAISYASNGETVSVPAGTCTWASAVTVPANMTNITLQGQTTTSRNATTYHVTAVDNTIIQKFGFAVVATSTIRITGFTFDGNISGAGTQAITLPTSPVHMRIDHNHFSYYAKTWNKGSGGGYLNVLLDNNLITQPGEEDIYFVGAGNASWIDGGVYTNNYTPGSTSPDKTTWVENNEFALDNADVGNPIDMGEGARVSIRHNLFSGTVANKWSANLIEAHGHCWGQRDGNDNAAMYSLEVSNNIVNNPSNPSYLGQNLLKTRGGRSFVYGNQMFNSGWDPFSMVYFWTQEVLTDCQEASEGAGAVAAHAAMGISSSTPIGNYPYDASGFCNAYPCPMQVNNSYIWNNSWSNGTFNATSSQPNYVTLNRDWWDDINGALASGLASARPPSCTAQTTYWETDTQTLYRCTSTNVWTPEFASYVYPHPLTATTHMGSTTIDIGAGARVFGNGRFYNINATNNTTADLSVVPVSGDLSNWIDISVSVWNNTGTREKTWTESSTNMGAINTTHTVGDLTANHSYKVSVDGIQGANITGASCSAGICTSDSSGKIYFDYTGGYSTHTFDVIDQSSIVAPTVTTSSASSVSTAGASMNGSISVQGGADATQSGFAWGTASNLSGGDTATTTLGAQTGTASFNSSISSLTCATTYYSRAYATNSGGTGYGTIVSFTTSACPVVSSGGGSSSSITAPSSRSSEARRNQALALAAQTPSSVPSISAFINALIQAGVIPADKAEAARTIVSSPSASVSAPRVNLQYHDRGETVRSLQAALAQKGYLRASPNGVFGPQTLSALKAFQKANGIPATGYYGPLTRGVMGR